MQYMPFKMENYYIWYAFIKNTAKYADLTEKELEEREAFVRGCEADKSTVT